MRTHKLSEMLRTEIRTCPESCYRIAKDTGIDKAALSRFLRGGSLKLKTVDILIEYFGYVFTKGKGGVYENHQNNAKRFGQENGAILP
jgi:hypothetical protein